MDSAVCFADTGTSSVGSTRKPASSTYSTAPKSDTESSTTTTLSSAATVTTTKTQPSPATQTTAKTPATPATPSTTTIRVQTTPKGNINR